MKWRNKNYETKRKKPRGAKSWIAFWRKENNVRVTTKIGCSVMGCSGEGLVGGHVVRDGSSNQHVYIIPLCRSCNAKKDTETFDIIADARPTRIT